MDITKLLFILQVNLMFLKEAAIKNVGEFEVSAR